MIGRVFQSADEAAELKTDSGVLFTAAVDEAWGITGALNGLGVDEAVELETDSGPLSTAAVTDADGVTTMFKGSETDGLEVGTVAAPVAQAVIKTHTHKINKRFISISISKNRPDGFMLNLRS